MAYYSLKAEFFITSDGIAIPKATPLTPRERRAIYDRDGQTCSHCGTQVIRGGNVVSPFTDYTCGCIDHIIPRSRGGQNDPRNLCVSCLSCNASMKAKI